MANFSNKIKGLLLVSTLMVTPVICSASYADELKVRSDVQAVTIYQNRAKIERQSKVELPRGAHTIIIENLPPSLDANSIRVAGKAVADVEIGTVKSDNVFTSELTSEREKSLNDQIEKLQKDVKRVEAEKQALNQSQQFLQKLGEQARLRSDENIAELNLKSDQWAAAARDVKNGLTEIITQKLEIDFKIADLNAQIQALQSEMNKARGGRKNYYAVSVAVEAEAATELTLDLSYFTYNATWQPLYDARLDKGKDGQTNLELVQYGAVSQSTGEDWANVSLALSTAQPNRNVTLGELSPYWVDMYDPAQNKSKRLEQAMGGAAVPMQSRELSAEDPLATWRGPSRIEEANMMDAAPMPKAATIRQTNIESNGFNIEYKLPGKVSVKSDGSETKLRIGTAKVTHDMKTVVRPQLATDAFYIAKITVGGDAPLLAGQVALFRDDAFFGNSYIPFIMSGKTYDMSYGVNDNVTVAFKTLKDENEEGGIISDNARQKQMVAEIENLSNENFDLIVEMAHPVSKNEDLDITLQKGFTTGGYTDDFENKKGIMHWESELQPKSKKEYKLGYELSWPKGYYLNGRY